MTLFLIFVSFTVIYAIVALVSGLFIHSNETGRHFMEPLVWDYSFEHMLGFGALESYLTWLFIVLGTLVFLQVNDKYGPGNFISFLRGKYFHPRREERIFMFLDLRSSTSIAEQLQEKLYFHLLKDLYTHITPAILSSRGEIYQYVGDEIVISWPVKSGTYNANCIKCFFQIQRLLQNRKVYYRNHYGIDPEFKAGLHYGYVMAGEIGVVKRDIAYSGDVLNTASRIQEKCNELGVNILISEYLVQKLKPAIQSYSFRKMGEIILRGKRQQVALFTL